jgi:hypothetical protein
VNTTSNNKPSRNLSKGVGVFTQGLTGLSPRKAGILEAYNISQTKNANLISFLTMNGSGNHHHSEQIRKSLDIKRLKQSDSDFLWFPGNTKSNGQKKKKRVKQKKAEQQIILLKTSSDPFLLEEEGSSDAGDSEED